MMLNRTLDAVMPGFRQIFRKFGITEQQWRVLRVLSEVPEIPLTELAGVTLIPAPSLVGVIDRLQTAGLVARHPAKQDRRVVFVTATLQGRELLERLLPQVANAYATLKQSVAADDWEKLMSGLAAIVEAAQSRAR